MEKKLAIFCSDFRLSNRKPVPAFNVREPNEMEDLGLVIDHFPITTIRIPAKIAWVMIVLQFPQ